MKTAIRITLTSLAILVATSSAAHAAMRVHLWLKIDGTDVAGEAAQLGREGSIECWAYTQESNSPAVGSRTHGTIVCEKAIDKTSPAIYQALIRGSSVQATFKFYRPVMNAGSGAGSEQQFHTVEIGRARITHVREVVNPTYVAANGSIPAMEEVTFSFSTISWTNVQSGSTTEDSVR